ncbi:RES domain-containing protein [Dyadobacter sp. BE34]|uniref:RES domain-containing protein n=1 Tax=Dyadobacter fermentans TaxID=94254 RepID=A0ABU1R3J8_9BACT|nr:MULTISPECIES: RES family NAD+ phosphorylase [Dyadobacter]MDR6807987.1 RES domain-containing protein [Dyadobacter fermentans]MDR7046197.1 RES domain-containing protein [Dyadobacter sp. BE242]MDR7200510.1 RES domain-containing protein [Dyadobacter sp. BE34]MDR7218470.1 RES domain-containing protein [Dyadobacter sp. BE31]MDR7266401.1 RES domain-containing protein [Dyadobacter sp. BE32]
MIAYRLAARAYIDDLSGSGAKLFGGRWNPVGCPCIYASQNLSLALLEKYVHAEFRESMERLALLRIDIPDDDKLVFHVDDRQLKKNWANDISYSQWIGEQILTDPEIIAFTTPSAIVPSERNVILNPLAKKFGVIQFLPAVDFSADLRLLAKLLTRKSTS